jgi:hypothetical protein
LDQNWQRLNEEGRNQWNLIEEYEATVITPAKAMVATVIDLLAQGATKAKEVKQTEKPPITKEQYLKSSGPGSCAGRPDPTGTG